MEALFSSELQLEILRIVSRLFLVGWLVDPED
jgi:hypothetical protein